MLNAQHKNETSPLQVTKSILPSTWSSDVADSNRKKLQTIQNKILWTIYAGDRYTRIIERACASLYKRFR
jgi:hypothetical protein